MDEFVQEVLLTHEEIVATCKRLGKQIRQDYKTSVPVLVGLLKGSIPFMAELIKHIPGNVEIDFIHASSYVGTMSSGAVMILKDITTHVSGRDLLLVEDIVDTGLTLKEVTNLLKDRGANSIEIVTLLDKPDGRTVLGVNPKYIGKSIPNKFVIGFGLDYNELYRNLDYVGVLKESIYKH